MKILILALSFAAALCGQTTISGNPVISGTINTCTPSGGSDTYACTLPGPLSAYGTGVCYGFVADVANTGAASINFTGAGGSALGAKTIKKISSGAKADLSNNDIIAGMPVRVCYDGTDMVGQGLGSGGSSPVTVITCKAFGTAQNDTLSTDGATYSTFTSTDITNTEAAFNTTCTIPSGTFVAGTYVQFRALVVHTTSGTAPTRQFRVRLTNASGTVLVDGGASAPGNSLTYRPITLNWGCMGTAAAGAAVNIACQQEQLSAANSLTLQNGWGSISNTTAGFQATGATNGDLVFVLTVDLDADAATAGNMAQLVSLKAYVWQ